MRSREKISNHTKQAHMSYKHYLFPNFTRYRPHSTMQYISMVFIHVHAIIPDLQNCHNLWGIFQQIYRQHKQGNIQIYLQENKIVKKVRRYQRSNQNL